MSNDLWLVTDKVKAISSYMFRAQMEDSRNKFARDIKAYPNPAILLASDCQLKDVTSDTLARYATFGGLSGILTK